MDSKSNVLYLGIPEEHKGTIMEGKTKKRKQRNTQFKKWSTSKAYKRNSEQISNTLNSCFNFDSQYGCIWLSLVLLPWDLWTKSNCLQKATVQSPLTTMVWRLRETWALQVDFFQFCTSREGIQHICLVYTKLHALSYPKSRKLVILLFW